MGGDPVDRSAWRQMRLPAIAKRLDHEREGRRVLAAAWVVKVIRRARRAPVRQHPDQLPLLDCGFHLILGKVGEPWRIMPTVLKAVRP